MTYDGQYYYSFDMFEKDIAYIYDQVKDNSFDLIIAINRGGLVPATCLSHALNIPMTTIDFSLRDGINISPKCFVTYFQDLAIKYKNILLVDDLVDSGKSVFAILSIMKQFINNTSLAVMAYNIDVNISVDCYYGMAYSRKIDNRYFDFWWEKI